VAWPSWATPLFSKWMCKTPATPTSARSNSWTCVEPVETSVRRQLPGLRQQPLVLSLSKQPIPPSVQASGVLTCVEPVETPGPTSFRQFSIRRKPPA
jgi:hypothetical protein